MAAIVLAGGFLFEFANPKRDMMLTSPCRGGKGCLTDWTLTSRLGQILETYEKSLGPRNQKFRVLGIEFITTGGPKIWYPNFGNGFRSVIVQLTQNARHDRSLALFQLSHEAFHLIEPIDPGATASYFEEGLASHFAVTYLSAQGVADGASYIAGDDYQTAYSQVMQLSKLHSDFDARLKRFRESHGSFSRITASNVQAAFPKAPKGLAEQLARPFKKPPSRQ